MKSFALLGYPIKHSKSPEIYQSIMNEPHRYVLLETKTPPTLAELRNVYSGINITMPFKKHYLMNKELSVVDLNFKPCSFSAINCLLFTKMTTYATNTDLVALRDLVVKYNLSHFHSVILGMGAMGQLLAELLNNIQVSYEVRSRRTTSVNQIFNRPEGTERKIAYINCFERGFPLKIQLTPNDFFWDLNYHQDFKSSQQKVDGYELLLLQAKYAVQFWNNGDLLSAHA